MSVQPDHGGGPSVAPYRVVDDDGRPAVVVPMAHYLRLRALERQASPEALEDAEDTAALEELRAREAAGTAEYVPFDEALQRLGITL